MTNESEVLNVAWQIGQNHDWTLGGHRDGKWLDLRGFAALAATANLERAARPEDLSKEEVATLREPGFAKSDIERRLLATIESRDAELVTLSGNLKTVLDGKQALRSQLEALMPYVQHKPTCARSFGSATWQEGDPRCTCVLASLLADNTSDRAELRRQEDELEIVDLLRARRNSAPKKAHVGEVEPGLRVPAVRAASKKRGPRL